MKELLTAVSPIFSTRIGQDPIQDPHLQKIVRAIEELGSEKVVEPKSFALMDRWLETAVSLAAGHEGESTANALLSVSDKLRWGQSYANYIGEPDIDLLRANYGYTLLAAPALPERPSAHFACDSILFGFSIQAPHTLYPSHVHKAVEFYYVLGGTAVWQWGDQWQTQPPGTLIFHNSGVRHAMQTHNEPLLTLFAWTTDLFGQNVIVRA